MKHKKTEIFKNTISQNTDGPAKTALSGTGEVEIGPPVEFGGSDQTLNPEEMFVASINACLMTTFRYFTQKFNVQISSYFSQARGEVEKQSDGFRFTRVDVRAKVQLPDPKAAQKAYKAGELAEKYCLVSRSVTCEIGYHLEIEHKLKKPIHKEDVEVAN